MIISNGSMNRLAGLLFFSAAVGLVTGCDDSASTQPAPSATPPAEDQLLFSSERTGHSQLYTIAANGASGTLVRLLESDGDALDAVWSPDGTRIAFTMKRGDAHTIYWIEASGETVTPRAVTSLEDNQAYPSWSPDGQRILFTSDRYENIDVSRLAVDGAPDSRVDLTDVKYPGDETRSPSKSFRWRPASAAVRCGEP